MTRIDHGLAVSLASQVSLGLTPGDGHEQRMYGALTAIGLMVRNADRSEEVQTARDLAANCEVTQQDGVTTITFTPPAS